MRMTGRLTGADIRQRIRASFLNMRFMNHLARLGMGTSPTRRPAVRSRRRAAGPSHDAAWSHSAEATVCGPSSAESPSAWGRCRPATVRSMISSYESAAVGQLWFWWT